MFTDPLRPYQIKAPKERNVSFAQKHRALRSFDFLLSQLQILRA